MKKITNKFKAVAKCVGVLIVLLVIILITNSTSDNPSIDSPSIACKQKQLSKIGLEVLGKKVETIHGFDYLFLKTKFVNNAEKEVKIARGNLIFSDLSGHQRYNIDLGYPRAYRADAIHLIESIPTNSSRAINFPINYSKFIEGLFWLNTTPLKNMKCEWTLQKIIYDDGIQDEF